MTKDEEREQLRAENIVVCAHVQEKDEKRGQANKSIEDVREGLTQAIMALEYLQERVKAREGQQAKESHNSRVPPSSDRCVRAPKRVRQKSGKKPGAQPGHRGHHLQHSEKPDAVLVHPVACCTHGQHDLLTQPAVLPERRQVFDVPPRRLWVTEHRGEEKPCPHGFPLTRASFPPEVKAPAQDGTGIAALAVSLVEGQSVPSARASQWLRELLGLHLSAGSIAHCVLNCSQQ